MSKPKRLQYLSELIATPSVNPMGQDLQGDIYSEKNITDLIAGWCRKLGLDVEIDNEDPVHPNVIATMDNQAEQTIVLDAHLDTVSHLNMSIDPFDPKIENERLLGRGSCDTKGAMAIYLAVLENILAQEKKPKVNIIICGLALEEFSFGGVRQLIKKDLKADFAIVGEPTDCNALIRHKGVYRCYIKAKGKACHSSTPELGENAIYEICEAALRLKEYNLELEKRVHPILGKASLSVGMIDGGTTVNTVPDSAKIEIDRRLLPGETLDSVHAEFVELLQDLKNIKVEPAYAGSGGHELHENHHSCVHFSKHCQAIGHSLEFTSAAFATHAPFYGQIQIPAIVFGPGSINQAHTIDEYVPLSDLEKAENIIKQVLCGP